MENSNLYKYFLSALKYPPYFIILFYSSVFVLLSISTGRFFWQSFLIFLYSIVGIFWRHIIKDIEKLFGWDKKDNKNQNYIHPIVKKIIILFYQIGNIVLLIFLFTLLFFIFQRGK